MELRSSQIWPQKVGSAYQAVTAAEVDQHMALWVNQGWDLVNATVTMAVLDGVYESVHFFYWRRG